MKLIFALGNPESRYDGTRHNIGYAIIDKYASEQGSNWSEKSKFKAIIAEASASGEKILLAKPTTYYNNSGEAARAIADFYNIEPRDILIIHDDIDLPFGTVCTRIASSAAGNNGLKSISQHIGDETCRVRIGTKNELSEKIDASDFVLSRFNKEEQSIFQQDIIPAALSYVDTFLTDNFVPTKCNVIKSPKIDI